MEYDEPEMSAEQAIAAWLSLITDTNSLEAPPSAAGSRKRKQPMARDPREGPDAGKRLRPAAGSASAAASAPLPPRTVGGSAADDLPAAAHARPQDEAAARNSPQDRFDNILLAGCALHNIAKEFQSTLSTSDLQRVIILCDGGKLQRPRNSGSGSAVSGGGSADAADHNADHDADCEQDLLAADSKSRADCKRPGKVIPESDIQRLFGGLFQQEFFCPHLELCWSDTSRPPQMPRTDPSTLWYDGKTALRPDLSLAPKDKKNEILSHVRFAFSKLAKRMPGKWEPFIEHVTRSLSLHMPADLKELRHTDAQRPVNDPTFKFKTSELASALVYPMTSQNLHQQSRAHMYSLLFNGRWAEVCRVFRDVTSVGQLSFGSSFQYECMRMLDTLDRADAFFMAEVLANPVLNGLCSMEQPHDLGLHLPSTKPNELRYESLLFPDLFIHVIEVDPKTLRRPTPSKRRS